MNDRERKMMIDAALAARQKAYAPYSKFFVGAAVLTNSGRIYCGCNVENASYGLTLCAERAAIVCAVCNGDLEFLALVVATSGGASPCGACRQFMAEFQHDLPILIIDAERVERVHETSLDRLLPEQFRLRQGE